MRPTPLLALALLFTSCTSNVPAPEAPRTAAPIGGDAVEPGRVDAPAPVTEEGYRASLDRWVGRPVSEVIAEWGAPRAVYEGYRGAENYYWVRNEGEIDFEGQRMPGSCATHLYVNKVSGKVVSFRYDGNTCKAADRWSRPGVPIFSIVDTSRPQDDITVQWFRVVAYFGVEDPPLQSLCGPYSWSGGLSGSCAGSKELPAHPMKLRLSGSHLLIKGTAADADALRAKGILLEVQGDVDFTPIAGHEYVVNGTLAPGQSAVWVEDKMTRQPVTAIVRE